MELLAESLLSREETTDFTLTKAVAELHSAYEELSSPASLHKDPNLFDASALVVSNALERLKQCLTGGLIKAVIESSNSMASSAEHMKPHSEIAITADLCFDVANLTNTIANLERLLLFQSGESIDVTYKNGSSMHTFKARVDDIDDPSQRHSVVSSILYVEIVNIIKAKVSLEYMNDSLDKAANGHNININALTGKRQSSSLNSIPHRLTGIDLLASLNAEMNNGELKLAFNRSDLSLDNAAHMISNDPDSDVKKLATILLWSSG
jgi:hypothetical protein